MSSKNQFEWVNFYGELAEKLLTFKAKRDELIDKVKEIYNDTGIKLPTLERNNNLVDIDPFTFFGLFNKNLTDSNRVKILQAVAKIFNISAIVPTSFAGIPILNATNATYYLFIDERGSNDIDDLWELFTSALEYAKSPSDMNKKVLAKYFDIVINKKGNANSKITMALFWIAPDTFLNLDQRNTWYIYESGKIPVSVVNTLPAPEYKISSAKYFEITEKIRTYLQSKDSMFKDFKELSAEAWRYSQEVNDQKHQIQPVIESIPDAETTHYWLYSPGNNACIWNECYDSGIIAIGWDAIGDLSQYSTSTEMKKAMQDKINPEQTYKMSAYATWQFVHEMKIGDVIFAKKGRNTIIGRGVVASGYEFDDSRKEYKNIRKVTWTHNGEWPAPAQAPMKTLTDITPYNDYVENIKALFEDDIDDAENEAVINYEPYTAEDFLNQVFMNKENYETLVNLVSKKKNVILQGAPGVGKTIAAKRLAYSIMGVKDPNRVMMVQFHQSYSYEDFVMGFRPSESGFDLKRGAFYNFCKTAEIDSDNSYFFIIDEINRGNLSQIFGELFMLIENDKRDIKLKLMYSDESFSVPSNVYIIGTMNTADRSLAMLDYALRRRFSFFEIKPGFDSEGFQKYSADFNSQKFNNLINKIKELNSAITDDETLGEGFCIGHSYFCNLTSASYRELSDIVEYEIIPLLKEYWFDEPAKIKNWSEILRDVIK